MTNKETNEMTIRNDILSKIYDYDDHSDDDINKYGNDQDAFKIQNCLDDANDNASLV